MMIFKTIVLLAFSVCLSLAADSSKPWPFFPFDNGVGRGVWPAAKQAKTVKELGYDGIHYNYTNPKDFAGKIAACKAAGVQIRAMYIYTFVDKPGAEYDPGIKEVIRMLKGSQTMIWLTLRDGKIGQQDTEAVGIVREIASLAAESGLSVSIYPHAGFYVATTDDAVRIAKTANISNVGVGINLCHELFAGNSQRLDQVIKNAGSLLNAVSVNGASAIPGKGSKAWETLALGSGTYDTTGFLRQLWDSGYRGPIGHQFFGVTGDDMQKLSQGISTWKKVKAEVCTESSAAIQ